MKIEDLRIGQKVVSILKFKDTERKSIPMKIVGLFEDPMEAKQFEGYCTDCIECKECIDYELEEFPIDNDMIDPMIELTIQELVILFGQAQQDLTNDSNDDVANNRRKQ